MGKIFDDWKVEQSSLLHLFFCYIVERGFCNLHIYIYIYILIVGVVMLTVCGTKRRVVKSSLSLLKSFLLEFFFISLFYSLLTVFWWTQNYLLS